MTRAIFSRPALALLAATAATPAMAQHGGHSRPTPLSVPMPPPAPAATCTAEHAAMGHCTMPAPTPPAPAPACTAEHAAMGHCTMPAPTPPAASSTCTAEHAAMGHCTMPASASPAPPVGPPPAAALSGPEHAADRVFGAERMEPSRRELIGSHGGMAVSRLRIERLEARIGDGTDGYAWEADFFHGGPIDRLWLKTEGEGAFGDGVEHGEVQALWSHAITPFFDLQAGLRHDFGPDPDRTHLALGLFGTAPYWFEIDAVVFLSDEGELTARIEVEYDLRITQRLILQPLVEVTLSAQDVAELGIGAGLSRTEAGLRLRYEIVPEFAPYVGLVWDQAYRRTADLAEAAGDASGAVHLLAGVRLWF